MRLGPPLLGISTFSIFLIVVLHVILVQGQSDDENFKRKTSNQCTRDSDCPDNAFCKQSTGSPTRYCFCKNDYIITLYNSTHRECVREATTLGDVCKVNLQCQSRLSVHASCRDGVCVCNEGAHFEDGRCYETALIGQSCKVTQNCYLGPGDSISNEAYCVRGVCTCSLLHSPRDGGTRCVKDAELGDPCEDDEHCAGANTRCHGVCRCEQGYVAYDLEKRCLRMAISLGDPCELESQCTSRLNGTTCIDQICTCGLESHPVNGSCWTTRYKGQRCIRDQECKIDDHTPGLCVNGICTCQGCEGSPLIGAANQMSAVNIVAAIFVATVVYVIGTSS